MYSGAKGSPRRSPSSATARRAECFVPRASHVAVEARADEFGQTSHAVLFDQFRVPVQELEVEAKKRIADLVAADARPIAIGSIFGQDAAHQTQLHQRVQVLPHVIDSDAGVASQVRGRLQPSAQAFEDRQLRTRLGNFVLDQHEGFVPEEAGRGQDESFHILQHRHIVVP